MMSLAEATVVPHASAKFGTVSALVCELDVLMSVSDAVLPSVFFLAPMSSVMRYLVPVVALEGLKVKGLITASTAGSVLVGTEFCIHSEQQCVFILWINCHSACDIHNDVITVYSFSTLL